MSNYLVISLFSKIKKQQKEKEKEKKNTFSKKQKSTFLKEKKLKKEKIVYQKSGEKIIKGD